MALGREMALSSVYKLLHRHNWRKLAPDKRHPQSNPVAQEDWKKTPRNARRNPPGLGQKRTDPTDVSGRGAFWAHQRRASVLGSQARTTAMSSYADHEYTYAYAAGEAKSGELDSLILPHVNTDCMQLFLDEVVRATPATKS